MESKSVAIPFADERVVLLQEVADLIIKAKALRLKDSVFLLNVVYVDLQTKINGIGDDEFQAFTSVIRSRLERS